MCYKTDKQNMIAVQLEDRLTRIPRFMRNYFATLKSKVTRKNNFGHIVALFSYFLEQGIISKKSLIEIVPDDIQMITSADMVVYLDLLSTKNSPETIATKKNIFGSLWSYFVRSGYTKENIVHDIDKNRFKPEKSNVDDVVKVPTQSQVHQFRKAILQSHRSEFEISRNFAIVELFMGSGIRSEELIGLDLEDLHLDDEEPHIYVMGKGKQYKKDRAEVVPKRIIAIQNYLLVRERMLQEWGIQSEALFLSGERKRISKSALDNIFRKYSSGEITPHDLRHWFGTRLYNSTKNIKLVQEQLRHSSLETAARYYVKVDKGELRKAIANL